MKAIVKRTFLVVAVLAAGLGLATVSVTAAEQNTKVTIPLTTSGIWQAIDQHVAMLKSVIATGKLGEAHEHVFAVRDLVRALPEHSHLSDAALATVKSNVKFVDTLAERIDQTGDANDKAGTQSNLDKLEGVLKSLRSQYGNAG